MDSLPQYKPSLPLAVPPWTKLGKKLESLCRKAIYAFDLFPEGGKVTVALSGGKDSLTLLYLLKAISGRGIPPLELSAVHVAGDFSCGASLGENFLKPICDALEVPLLIRHSTKKRENLTCYSCSRERRNLLFSAAKELGSTTLAFGHHRDDSIQTLLMNLCHKAEFAANLPKVPMQKYGITIVRPLLYIPEDEIRQFAILYGFSRIVCQCPVGQHSLRQKTKKQVELLEKVFPNVKNNLFLASLEYGSDKALYDSSDSF